MEDNKDIVIFSNGHKIVCEEFFGDYAVCNMVHDANGEIDLAAYHDCDGYEIPRTFQFRSDALHYMRQCVKASRMSWEV